MKILDIEVMRGPNYWSIKHQHLIVMRLDLEELEQYPTNKIDGFSQRIEQLLPSLYEHQCSEGHKGGFFERVKDGTWMGHVIEHIALEIQNLAGMDLGFGRTRSTNEEGIYYVVFSYTDEKAGLYTAEAAVRIANALVKGESYNLEGDIKALHDLWEEGYLGPSTTAIVEEAQKRGIPFYKLNDDALIQLGQGVNQKRIRATISSHTNSIAVDIAGSKEETKQLLRDAAIPVPDGKMIRTEAELEETIDSLGYPLVIKPADGNQGKGATIGITTREGSLKGLQVAKKFSDSVIVEKYISGFDYRFLVINYKFVAAAKRTPAAVTGDGKSTIQELIDIVNQDPCRGSGHEKTLTSIKVDEITLGILQDHGLTLQSVLKENQTLYLKRTANLSTGGTATDVTDIVHPDNIWIAEHIARIVGLDICGIDIMAKDIVTPITQNGGAVLEVNAAPGFRMHMAPTSGIPRNVAAPVVDMLFPPGSEARIPIVAITGTNGKTTTSRLMAHIAKNAGCKVGYTTTDGIYIQDRLMVKGDCTGPISTQYVLKDPTVDFAVLECARGGMMRSGLGFDRCDVGIVTNVSADHLGSKGIQTLEQMAKVKSIVPESVRPDGYAILNADDDLVYDMAKDVKAKVALFSMDGNNPRIKRHCDNGGIAAVVESGYVSIHEGKWKTRVDKVINIPLTMSGKADFMTQNVLAAVLGSFVRNISIKDIRQGLKTFVPSPEQTPGRLNIFEFNGFKVMVDYAHNPASMEAIGKFLDKIDDFPKVGIITGVGDRRDEDIVALGELAATIFDEIIIRQDKDLRGRTDMEIVNLLKKGIRFMKPDKPIQVIETEREAIIHAMKHALNGAFITVCSEDLTETLAFLKNHKETEDNYVLEGERLDSGNLRN